MKDPALDMTAEELEAYAKSRDPALIKEKPGMRAVRHYVRPMRADAASMIETVANAIERTSTYYRVACHRIEDADGKAIEPNAKTDLEPWSTGRKIAKREWLATVADVSGFDAIVEVGLVIGERACMRRDERGPLW
jgi:hypothetical protein